MLPTIDANGIHLSLSLCVWFYFEEEVQLDKSALSLSWISVECTSDIAVVVVVVGPFLSARSLVERFIVAPRGVQELHRIREQRLISRIDLKLPYGSLSPSIIIFHYHSSLSTRGTVKTGLPLSPSS